MNRSRLVAAASLLTYAPLAAAYIDPNLGVLAIQGVIAALGAVLIGARRVRDAVRRFLARIVGRRSTRDPGDDA